MFYLLQKQLFSSTVLLYLSRGLSSTATATASLGRLAAVDYLVKSCGLTPEQALKYAKYIFHWKSTSNADAVLAFLAGPTLNLSKTEIANIVARDVRILNSSVDSTLKVRLDGFRRYGFSDAHIRNLLCVAPFAIRYLNIDEKLGFLMPFLGSPEHFLHILKRNYYFITSDLEKVIKPNIELLQECGLSSCVIVKICLSTPRILTSNPTTLKAIVARADKIGVPRSSRMFRHALSMASSLGPETMSAKFKLFGETLGWSEAESAIAVRKNPMLLGCSAQKLRSVSEFLFRVVRLDTKYILQRPMILMHSLEGRLVPRHYVMKVLQENGLIHKDHSYCTMAICSDAVFRHKYINAHKDVLPDLDHAYTVACKGKRPTGVAQ